MTENVDDVVTLGDVEDSVHHLVLMVIRLGIDRQFLDLFLVLCLHDPFVLSYKEYSK